MYMYMSCDMSWGPTVLIGAAALTLGLVHIHALCIQRMPRRCENRPRTPERQECPSPIRARERSNAGLHTMDEIAWIGREYRTRSLDIDGVQTMHV